MNAIRRKARQLLVLMLLAVGVVAVPVATDQASAAANVTVTISFQGNPCYIWGQNLSQFKAVIQQNGGAASATVTAYGSRTVSASLPGGASYNVRIQSWCSGIFLGRTAGGNRWAYASGYQPTWTFFAGVWTG